MPGLLSRIPFRESRGFVIACAVVFAVLLSVLLCWPRLVKLEKKIAARQAEQKAGSSKVVPTDWYVPVWLRKGWAINTALAGAMLLVSPWLGRRRRGEMRFVALPEPKPMKWQGYAIVAGLMLFAAWQNYPRLFLSMWGDEEFNASRFIVDEVSRNDAGSIEITPRSWETTLWSFRKTTNHLGFSALARLSHDTFFVKKTGLTDPFFSEALIRLPVFVAGLLFIPALVWCGRVWGLAGLLAALIAVLHPWFVRFGVDGRAYGLVMLGVPVMLALLGKGLKSGRWRWWLLLGLAEFFVFWCYFGSIYLLVALNLAALGLIFTGTTDKPARWLLLKRWIVSAALAKMLVIGMMAPCWPQLFEFLQQKPITGALDWAWWRDSFSELFFGSPWSVQDAGNLLEFSLARDHWILGALLWAAFGWMASVAVYRLGCDRVRRWLLFLFVGAPALMLAHMMHGGIKPYAWYLVPYLPGLLLILGGVDRSRGGKKRVNWLLPLSLAGFVFVTRTPRQILRHHPIEQSRESVALYRKVTNPRNPDIDKDVISGGFVMFTEGYDPAMHRFKDVAGLRALMDDADCTHRKLFINAGHIEFAREFGFADICKIIEDPAQFDHIGHLPGLFFSTTRDVFRYRGKGG